MNEEIAKRLALGIAVLCIRNTCIEEIHAGIEPGSQVGDFSDVKIVTPYGDIPRNNLSRISNDEMREFMKQVVDRIYTVLLRLENPEFVDRLDSYARRTTAAWDPEKSYGLVWRIVKKGPPTHQGYEELGKLQRRVAKGCLKAPDVGPSSSKAWSGNYCSRARSLGLMV
jgi:hypothetical protein